MNNILDNDYFYPKSLQKEFKTYDKPQAYAEGKVEGAPGEEPEKGVTSVIIPAYFLNYSVFHYTGHCIGSVHEHTDGTKTPYEIILVINGKTGIQLANLEESQADKVITLDENMGYGAAVNRGIRVARGEYIVLLNNDAMVFNHWLEDFQEALQFRDLVMGTPMYGRPYARQRESMKLRERSLSSGSIEESFSDFRDFSCVATRKALFSEIGLFDEKFFAYKEDLDIFNRMDKAGKKYASTKRVNTFHIIGSTSINMSDEQLHKEEGKVYYETKYGSA